MLLSLLMLKRPLIPLEHFSTLGVPLWQAAEPTPAKLLSALRRLTGQQQRALAGNMMHVGVVGSFVGYCLLDAATS